MRTIDRFRKLRKMSAREICARLYELSRQRTERRLYHATTNVSPDEGPVANLDFDRFRDSLLKLVPGARCEERQALLGKHPEIAREIQAKAVDRADEILSGTPEFLGHSIDLTDSIPWHKDPRSAFCWPRSFHADLNLFETDDDVDVKYTWELGRQRYVVDLARGWFLTQDKRYSERALALVRNWIDANPLYEGVHWSSALEVATRAISWLWSLALLADFRACPEADWSRIAASLREHANYLERHLSFYSSPYNHLIGEATALYLIGIALEQLPEASRWARTGRNVLEQYGPGQFYDDGFCVEQATCYHFYTLGFLSLSLCAARSAGRPLEALEQAVHGAYCAGAAFMQPDGHWPAIGDVDSARSIPVATDDFWDFRSLCSLGATLFNDASLKQPETKQSEEVYWLLGCDGLRALHGLENSAAPSAVVLPDSGYSVARRRNEWLLLSAGPIAAGVHQDATASTAHGHADALQLLFCWSGRPVLIDPGMPSYSGPRDWVDHFRGAEAHNTIQIDGVSQVERAGRLAWSHAQQVPKLEANLSERAWLAHTRAQWKPRERNNSTDIVVLERFVLCLPEVGLWIADWVESDRPRSATWYWQLPDDKVQCIEQSLPIRFEFGGGDLGMHVWSSKTDLIARVESSDEDSPIGWSAPGYGCRRKGQRLCLQTTVTDSHLLVTFVGNAPRAAEVTVRGQILCCRPWESDGSRISPAGTAFETVKNDHRADIVWHVETDDGYLEIAAGSSLPSNETGEESLIGAGNWPAQYRIRSVSPTSS